MGYVLPGWMDEILDFIGINWPNVDEDDYREMADAMREFADQFEGHGAEAHAAVSRILASSEGAAVDALQEHWDLVKSGHLEKVPDIARLFSDACDVVADIIFGMKTKAEIELGVMAASIGVSLGLAVVTGGLSAIVGAAETAAMRQLIKRIIDEAADQIVDELLARVTEPITGRLEQMVEDTVLDLTDNLIKLPPATGDAGAGGHGGSHTGMMLASAGGPSGGGGGGGGGRVFIDHEEYENGAGKLSRHGEALHTDSLGSLGRAKGAFGRTRGRDPFTQAFDSVLHGALNGAEKALKKVGKHLTEDVPGGLRATSRTHRQNDSDISDRLKALTKGDADTPKVPGARSGGRGGKGPDPLNSARDDARHHGVEPDKRVCRTDPVDVASGQMLLEQTDLDLPGVLPLVLKRTHLSDYTYGMWFGRSWASTLDERIEVDIRNQAMWAREDGTVLVYEQLPGPQTPEVWPLEGPRIPLRRISEMGAQDLEFAATDPRTGWTRYFSKPGGKGWQLWLTTIEDRNGNQIDIHRDATGRPLDITHSGGYDIKVTGDRGRVTALALRGQDDGEPALPVVDFGYDEDGDLTEVINSSGTPLRFTYDTQGRITSWTDRNDSTYRYAYDTAGRVVQTVGPDGFQSSTFVYDAEHRTTRWTNAMGAVTEFRLSERGQIIAEIDPLGHTTVQRFDDRDQLLARTDPLGRTTGFEWDEYGNLVTVEHADGRRTHVTYNYLHQPLTIVEPGGARLEYAYDERGNRTAVTNPAGLGVHYTHDASGGATAITNALGETVTIRCDRAGLPVELVDPLGVPTRYERDPFGRPVAIHGPDGQSTRLDWNAEGKLLRRAYPDGSTESWSYDGEGNCTAHTDPAGATTRFEYTHFDLVAARTGPDGVRYAFEYDAELRLRQVTNPQGLTWTYQYDAAGRLTAETDFDGRTLSYALDAGGQLSARTLPSGAVIGYERDILGRTVRKSVDGHHVTYAYDTLGELAQAASADCTVTFQRDAAGRIVAESVDERTLTFQYDALGRRTQRTTPTGAVSQYRYDAAGNRSSLSAFGKTITSAHDAAGREIARHISPHLALGTAYDELGRIATQSLHGSGGEQLWQRAYTYRPDGHVTTIDDARDGRLRLDLDTVGRVTSVQADNWSETYAYDEAGNQSTAQWPGTGHRQEAGGEREYQGMRVMRAGTIRYECDSSGRIVLRQKIRLSRKPDTWRYTWDAEDRLTSVTTPDGTLWRYLYDPLGRRLAKQRIAADGVTVVEETRFTWDGTTLVEQTTHTPGAPDTICLTWEHDGITPISQAERKLHADAPQDVVDQRFFAIITDLVGTPTELVDDQGHTAWRARSTLWGITGWDNGATAYTPLRFPGQYFDPETQLHYNYFRHYDPEVARYLTPDPLGLAPAPNPFAYVANPLTWIDPLGLAPQSCRKNEPDDPSWGGRVLYSRDGGRPGAMHATLGLDMMGANPTDPHGDPPGWEKDKGYNRAHLLGAQLGGSNYDPRNFVTMHSYANSPVMRHIENQVRAAVTKGEIIQYSVTPVYDGANKIPLGVRVEVHGNNGFQFTEHRSTGNTEPTNSAFIPNKKRGT
ncbi:RHS repeat-associated core domain-containing protein [Streptomyces sp. BK205]|uniref:RHS repeat-associated core domain-containing protein n=1 Tax=Streptomyces sp. BK205 TaxID=2512164 RepID=UPI0010529BC7|nr:RHS repeat-associated core domain-containing protein [Streptomyces sp. BK205]TCR15988.1 RHS repeat-associated protein [Streptomyces sp. BK205]